MTRAHSTAQSRKRSAPRLLSVALAVFAAVAGHAGAQTPQSLPTARDAYERLKASVKPQGELQREIVEIDKALAEALGRGQQEEARRLLARGTTLLNGEPWTDLADFAGSLVLRGDRRFLDPAHPFTLRVEQIYPSSLRIPAALAVRMTLRRLSRSSQPGPGQVQVGDTVKGLGTAVGVPPDFGASPFQTVLDLAGVRDGPYAVVVELVAGGQVLTSRGLAVDIRSNLDARLQRLEAGAREEGDLARALRADLLYPGDYIRRVNEGLIEAGDFDVEREIADAEASLAALAARRDPFAGRTGEFKRHYLMSETGEIMPYHLYVPESYDGRKPTPVVVALHGGGANEDSFFLGSRPQVPIMAEENGFLVAAPLGYRVDGGYGRTTPTSSQDPALARKRELSEADVLHVIELVQKAYRIDEDRIYLFGYSMGAAGAWHLAAKYPDRWAALACFSGFGDPKTLAGMRHIAQFVAHGDADSTANVEGSRAMVAEMKRLGIDHQYIEVPGGDHHTGLERQISAAFDFFARHKRRKALPPA